MKIYATLFIFFIAMISFGQTDHENKKVLDSIQNIMDANPQLNIDQLKARKALGEEVPIYRLGYWDSLVNDFRIVLQKNPQAEKELHAEFASSLNNLGFLTNNSGDFETGLSYFKECMKIQERNGDKEGVAQSNNNIAYILNNQGLFEESKVYYNQVIDIWKELGNDSELADAYSEIGIVYYEHGDSERAMEYYLKSLKIEEKVGNQSAIAGTLNNIAVLYLNQGNIKKAINSFTRILNIQEKEQDENGMCTSYNNIGYIYIQQGDFDIALDYFEKGLKLYQKNKDSKGMATCYSNMAHVYSERLQFDQSIEYYEKTLKIYTELNERIAIAQVLTNLGAVYIEVSKSIQNEDSILVLRNNALEFFSKSLAINEEIDSKDGISNTSKMLGDYYLVEYEKYHKKGDLNKAYEYGIKSLNYSKEIKYPLNIRNSASLMSKVYAKQGKGMKAYETYKLFIEMRDSINNEETQKAAIQQTYDFKYQKKTAQDSIRNIEEKKTAQAQMDAKLTKERTQRYALYGGLAVLVVFGLFMFNRFQITKKQKNIIADQKQQVDEAFYQLEEKNTEIMDSISYAKRIQSAILPPDKLITENLPNSFVLYKPKDIVAGDFYWMETLSAESRVPGAEKAQDGISELTKNKLSTRHSAPGTILLAAADCTGHGVPGAMVSVVCNNGLNRSVREYGLTDPGQILDKTRELVIQEFEKSEEEVKDGMDIALVSLSPRSPSDSRGAESKIQLSYAGAHNPLWIVNPNRKEWSEGCKLFKDGGGVEIRGDKQPIGKFRESKPFTTHHIDLVPGDTVYLFSDGYADQFGGETKGGKKFKTANFKKLLVSIYDLNMEQQKEEINKTFETWRGDLEQIDDVCIIGVRI